MFEALEPRHLLSVSARLAVWVESEQVDVPSSITGSSATYTENDGALTVSTSGATLDDLFEGWSAQNSSATFSSTELMGHQANGTYTVQMFVNGEVCTEFEDYVIREGDEIILVYGDNPVVSLNTNFGAIVIELFQNSSPASLLVDSSTTVVPTNTVANFLNYVNDGDYLDSIIHRSDPDFVIQGGGYTTNSTTFTSTDQFTDIETDDAIKNEPGLSNLRGTIAMAKVSGDADSATSQFFINLSDDNTFLDTEAYDYFTVFGQVLDMTTVNTIAGLTVNTDNSSPFGELPLGDGNELVVIESITGLGSVSGTEFYDADGDGIFDTGEAGIEGIMVYADADGDGVHDDGETYTTTDSNGEYVLWLEAGSYTIRSAEVSGYTQTLPEASGGHSVSVAIGEEISGADFGQSDMSAPSGVDLVADYDTGSSSTDNVTYYNNSSAGTILKFTVSGVLDGATVYLYCDGSLIGTATASGTTATVSTDAASALSDGTHNFTAAQSLSGVTSSASEALSVTIDATAPGAIVSTPPTTATINVTYTFDSDSPNEGENGLVYALSDEAPDGMTINSSTGVISWTPSDDQAVPQEFDIVVSDLAGNSVSTAVAITVYGDIPAVADAYTVTEDGSLTVDAASGVLVNDGDDDVPYTALTASLVSNPSHGTVSFSSDGSFTYTPYGDFYGTDSFTYQATDGESDTNVAKVTITVTNVNDSPVGKADTYSMNEDETLTVSATNGVLANDTDVDGDTLSATLATDVSNGTLSLNSDGSFTYTPDSEFSGTDSFTYVLSDGSVTIDSITVTITVAAVNDAPTGVADSYTVAEDGTLTVSAANGVLANDSDPEGGSVTATLSAEPSNGTVAFNADGSFTYTPDANFYGTDTFTYTATDGTNVSGNITVTITVTSVGDAPTATADAYTVSENSTSQLLAVLNNDSSDPDGDQTLTITAVTQGTQGGTVVISGNYVAYTPAAGFTGTDTFTYTITDADGLTATATVTVTVSSANNSLAGYVYIDLDSDSAMGSSEIGVPGVLITLTGTDNNGNSVTRTAVTNSAGYFQFTGLAAGTYVLTESQAAALLDGAEATGITDAVVGEDKISNITLSGDSSGVCYFGEAGLKPTQISVRMFLASTPEASEYLTELMAAAEEAAGNTDLAEAIRNGETTLDNANTPVAVADSYAVAVNTTLTVDAASGVLANDSDADGDALTAVLVSDVANGTLTLSDDGSFTYVPDDDFEGTDTFTYYADDGELSSSTVTVTITVGASSTTNTAPTAVADSYSATEDTTLEVAAATGVLANDSDADGDDLTATLVSDVANGTLTLNSDGSFTYVPDADFNGTDTFSYKASDGTATSNTVTVTITVATANDSPTGKADSYSVNENATLTVAAASGVLANDTDVDGDTLTAVLVTDVVHGTLTLSSDGSFTYTPNEDYSGTDTFVYQASDGLLGSAGITVTITIGATNTAPVAAADAYAIDEDGTLTVAAASGVLANDSDADGDTLTATLISNTTNGTLTLNADGSFTYVPDADFHGTDTFGYQASDGTEATATTYVTITVNSIDDAPVAVADYYRIAVDMVAETDAEYGVLSNDTDADGDTLTAALATSPANGTLDFASDGSFTYTPNEGFQGIDTFTYTATDGTNTSDEATVTIYVNTLPALTDDAYEIDEDETLTVTVGSGVLANDSDGDGDDLTVTVATEPSNGTLTLNADGSFTYVPDANFNGTDTFTYTANDGFENSAEATVTITVNSVEDTPVAVQDTYRTAIGTALTVTAEEGVLANDSDGDGDDLTAALLTSPSNGALVFGDDGSFTYTPDADYHGADSFTYTVSDDTGLSATGTVTIYVNSQAVATADSYIASEDTTVSIDAAAGVLANDSDADSGDTLTAVLVTDVSNGTLTLSPDGSFTYVPDANFNGTDTFTYAANDGYENSEAVTVTITVSAVNDAPVAADDSYSTALDTALTVEAENGLLANDSDVDGDGLAVTLVASPSHGSLTLQSDGSFTYTPVDGYQGTDTFTYRTTDGSLNSDVATVMITINNGVFAYDDDYEVNEDEVLEVDYESGVLANDSDTDGDTLTVTLVTTTSHGTLSLSVNGAFIYTPSADFYGTDSFVYTASDGLSESAATTVKITVVAQPDAPIVVNDTYRTPVDEELSVDADAGVLANDTDADGDTLTPTIVTEPSHGAVTLNADGSFTYTPDEGFQGTDTFTYKVTDATGEVSNSATVTIEVNALPTVADDTYAVDEDNTLAVDAGAGVLHNDADADGDTLTVTLVTDASHGTLALGADGSFSYTPDADFYGTDSFTYTVNDGLADSGLGTVTITVNQVSKLEVLLELVDEDGASISTAAVGDTVVLNVYVQDIRAEASGVQKAALDLTYDSELLTFTGYTYGDSFVSSVAPDISTAGTVDELWAATDGSDPSGGARVLFCSISFTVTGSGSVEFSSAMAESYDTALTDDVTAVLTVEQIKFHSASLEIIDAVDAVMSGTDEWL